LIRAQNPGPLTGAGNNTWLLDGRVPTLVDAGIGHPNHLAAIAEHLGDRSLARVLVTHGHADHASGAPALMNRWPDVKLCKRLLPAEDRGPWRPLGDGDRIAAGDDELIVVATPGHAIDHVCFWNPVTRDVFAGDMVARDTTILIPAGRGGGLRAYLHSLGRLADLAPARILPGHGPIIDQPLALIAQYIAHRHEREAQILACLAEGVTDPDAIVARVYRGLAKALVPFARQSVEAHLEKIAEDRLS
jgi:glyoxylase-like metal-dependent hydrolase (beta-lactamase superfamily II)